MKDRPKVGIVIGSASDKGEVEKGTAILKRFGIPFELRIISAHRTPELAAEYAKGAASRGISVIIAGAGYAAHLAGAMAANTILPVIGVPLAASSLGGLDSLLSTVQMPKGIPVATVTIGGVGMENAALLAAEILALNNESIRKELIKYREEMKKAIKDANEGDDD
jgi:phosphoribosylaminoimidazole carboxylase PurE protein